MSYPKPQRPGVFNVTIPSPPSLPSISPITVILPDIPTITLQPIPRPNFSFDYSIGDISIPSYTPASSSALGNSFIDDYVTSIDSKNAMSDYKFQKLSIIHKYRLEREKLLASLSEQNLSYLNGEARRKLKSLSISEKIELTELSKDSALKSLSAVSDSGVSSVINSLSESARASINAQGSVNTANIEKAYADAVSYYETVSISIDAINSAINAFKDWAGSVISNMKSALAELEIAVAQIDKEIIPIFVKKMAIKAVVANAKLISAQSRAAVAIAKAAIGSLEIQAVDAKLFSADAAAYAAIMQGITAEHRAYKADGDLINTYLEVLRAKYNVLEDKIDSARSIHSSERDLEDAKLSNFNDEARLAEDEIRLTEKELDFKVKQLQEAIGFYQELTSDLTATGSDLAFDMRKGLMLERLLDKLNALRFVFNAIKRSTDAANRITTRAELDFINYKSYKEAYRTKKNAQIAAKAKLMSTITHILK